MIMIQEKDIHPCMLSVEALSPFWNAVISYNIMPFEGLMLTILNLYTCIILYLSQYDSYPLKLNYYIIHSWHVMQ